MNYGHALEFGTFITPLNASPDRTVALAQLSEELGYDLVTFQDHPYQPAYLDAWTLLSWVAGQTERIHMAANVLNMQMRDPIMISHAAASLDLLSGGRLDLALGAGGFSDAVAAMTGTSLTPGQSVDALSEAIDIIRASWDVGSGDPLHFDGDYHRIDGAQRGPAPARDVPIWLGALKPRMSRLVGSKADGWMPSLGYMKPGEFQTANTIIDEAARRAGRDPREIRRIVNISGQFSSSYAGFLNGPVDQWIDELLPLVVNDGVGTFVLMSDEPETLEQFAREVIPSLKLAVASELPNGLSATRVRSTSVRSKRRDRIDYDGVPASLADSAIEPGDSGFSRVRSTYLRGGSPGLVLRPGTVGEVVDAIAFAREHTDLPFSVRSAGHGISGRSTNDGGLVVSLAKLNSIEVIDAATRRVRIGPGARWADVAAVLSPYGWALSSGDYGGVGVGGLATAGGIGWMAREHGLTIDHLRAVDMVLADGSVVRASDDENTDLFWAVRGAGANFGIVTSFEFEVDEVGDIGWAQLAFDASDIAGFLEKWGAAVESAPRDLTSFVIIGAPRNGQPPVAQVMAVVDSSDPETIISRLQPMADIAPMYDQRVVITSYAAMMNVAEGGAHNGQGEPVTRSGLIGTITPEFAAAAERFIRSGATYFFQLRAVGGAVSDVDPDATAYAHRSASFSVVAFGANRQRMNAMWTDLYQYFDGLYLSFETDLRPDRLDDAFPLTTMYRLRDLKSRYDPDNLFRDNFNIRQDVLVGSIPAGPQETSLP